MEKKVRVKFQRGAVNKKTISVSRSTWDLLKEICSEKDAFMIDVADLCVAEFYQRWKSSDNRS